MDLASVMGGKVNDHYLGGPLLLGVPDSDTV